VLSTDLAQCCFPCKADSRFSSKAAICSERQPADIHAGAAASAFAPLPKEQRLIAGSRGEGTYTGLILAGLNKLREGQTGRSPGGCASSRPFHMAAEIH